MNKIFLLLVFLIGACGLKQEAIIREVVGIQGPAGPKGDDGQDGSDANTPYLVVKHVTPCGPYQANQFPEILQRLANGAIIAHFASGARQHTTELIPGNYATTDNLGCNFSITNDMLVKSTKKLYASRGPLPDRILNPVTLLNIKEFKVPATLEIVEPTAALSASGQQWANISTNDKKYCYQMNSVTSKTLSYKFSLLASEDCVANSLKPNDGLANSWVVSEELTVTMQNNVKVSGTLVETKIKALVEVLE